MAQAKDYRSLYPELYDRTRWFVRWLTYPDGYTIRDSALGRQIAAGNQPDCVLDYVLAWLMEGRGAEQSPTYEDWLLTIISIADQLGRGIFHAEDVGDESGGDDHTIDQVRSESGGLVNLALPLLNDASITSHPALDRRVYNRARAEL